jgi:hypothetical protein
MKRVVVDFALCGRGSQSHGRNEWGNGLRQQGHSSGPSHTPPVGMSRVTSVIGLPHCCSRPPCLFLFGIFGRPFFLRSDSGTGAMPMFAQPLAANFFGSWHPYAAFDATAFTAAVSGSPRLFFSRATVLPGLCRVSSISRPMHSNCQPPLCPCSVRVCVWTCLCLSHH